jgi:drug/metabolite transporter (DMT)-like permease
MAIVAKLLFRDRGIDPMILVAVRSYLTTATLFLVLAVVRSYELRAGRAGWKDVLLLGAGLFGNNLLYFQAIALTTVATAQILQYQAPVLVALYTVLVQRQRLSKRITLSLMLAILGCALVIRIDDPEVLRLNVLGVLAGLGTAFAFAFYILAGRAALTRFRPWTLLANSYLVSSLAWLLIIPPWHIAYQGYDGAAWFAFTVIATLGTALPFGLFISGLRLLPATQASILSMIEPLVAVVMAYLVLGESLLPVQVLGGILVLTAVFLTEGA